MLISQAAIKHCTALQFNLLKPTIIHTVVLLDIVETEHVLCLTFLRILKDILIFYFGKPKY